MAVDLRRFVIGRPISPELVDALTAFGSGAVDGYLLRKDMGVVFLAKNIAIPIIHLLLTKLPKGLVDHAVGQLGLLLSLFLIKEEGE